MLPAVLPTDYNTELEETLLSYEIRWRGRQQFIESKGYMLRPRLRPGWIPSWKARGVHPMFCEDGALTPYRKRLIDATRMSDNKLVYIKRVETNDTESQIALMLNRGSLANDLQNHTVPILDTFEDDQDNTISYIVMPFLCLTDRPMFESVGEIVDFADQILEGLEFMHEHGETHRLVLFPHYRTTLISIQGLLREEPHDSVDTFQDDEDSSISYIVMPFLRLTHNPPFTNVGEIVDFANQFLEGLAFMHEHGVAHRDCSEKILMMDATDMYPLGFHPVKHTFLPDCNTPARSSIIPRSVASVRYYFVDFGISSFIPPDAPSKLVLGLDGRDQDVPELSDEDPYDPFKVDIFTIGNVFRRLFCDDFSNMEFLAPLIESMTREDPAQRPIAAEALRQWTAIRMRIPIFSLLWRLKKRNEGRIASIVADAKDLPHVSRQWLNWLIGRR